MTEHKMTAGELAEAFNAEVAKVTGGRPGKADDRLVRKWLSGEVSWPKELTRIGLQRVTGRTPVELGFNPRGRQAPTVEEDPVYRRAFLSAAAAAGAALSSPADKAPRRLGLADVDRMNAKLAAVVRMDDRYGGTPELEHHSAGLAQEALTLMDRHTASQKVRSEMYSVAAALTTSAMWAAIDGRRPEAAQRHLHQAITLAGLSGNTKIEFRVWGHASILFRQLGRHTDAVAAAERSRSTSIARRDPLYSSLALARLAIHHADLGETKAALHTAGLAQEHFGRVGAHEERPAWMRFYDQAELDSLAVYAHLKLRRWADAEQHAHRCLARLRPDLERNRALTHANLALAQLGQGDLEPAVGSAKAIPASMARRGRVSKLLNDFTTHLTATAPHAPETQEWTQHRSEAA
jgi:tetratricopeptide (TPR) repeat protein